MADTLYIVDGSGFIFRAYHALPPLTTRLGVPTGAVYGFTQMLIKLEQDRRPSHLVVVFDAAHRTFRNDIYPEYKAQRTVPPDDLIPQFKLVRQVVDVFGVPRLELSQFEADDVIATLARRARQRGMPVVIVSSDKDLMQMVDGKEIVLYDTMKDITYGPTEVTAKFGVPPAQLGDVLALMGDTSDNIPGIPGVGPKTAALLIQQFGSLDALFARVGEIQMRGAERVKQLVRDHQDKARLSRRLVTLDENVPLPVDIDSLVRRPPEVDRLEPLFRELAFDRLLARLRPPGAAGTAGNTASMSTVAGAATGMAMTSPTGAALEQVTLADAPPEVITTGAELSSLVERLRAAGELALDVEIGEGPLGTVPLMGLAVAAGRDGEGAGIAAYIPVGHRYLGCPPQLKIAEVVAALGPLLASREVSKRVHRFKEALQLLGRHGVALDGVVGDPELTSYLFDPAAQHDLTAIASRHGTTVDARAAICGTGKRVQAFEGVEVPRAAAYAARRARAALVLDRVLVRGVEAAGMGRLLHEIELPLARVLSRVEQHGVRLDVGPLATLSSELQREIERLEKEVQELAGSPVNLGSPKQLQELLFDKLGLPPVKKTKTGLSTDAEVLEELAALHPIAAKIHEHRVLAKLKSTYTDALPHLVDSKTGRLHTTFQQTVTATGRISSTEPNLQNIPIRTELGRKIRRAFVAEPGCLLIAADYSQIELRVVAHLSKDPVLLDAFSKGQDVHERTACEVFGVPADAVSPEQRRVAKAINYGIVYGQTDYGLSKSLGIHKAEARQYITSYFIRYAGVASFMEGLIAEARREMGARTLLGRFRRLPDLEARNRATRGYAERIARNTPIQGTAADLLKVAMIRVQERLDAEAPTAKMLLTVHDELVLEAPAAQAAAVGEIVRETMERVWPLDVPLKVDVGIGENWADC